MSGVDVQTILKQVEELLAQAGPLPAEAELAVERLLNVVEALSADRSELRREVERLRQQLELKKKPKTTDSTDEEDDDQNSKNDSDHSSEKRRRQRRGKKKRRRPDRRSFKDLKIHETIECPIDPETLPPDAVRVEDEEVIVQDVEIKPRNIRFQRSVYYSASEKTYFRAPLPSGYDVGDFGADLRSLILSLKYCGNMSEPKIGEFLENFDVQISTGSLSNILTNTAASFEGEFHELFTAGLASTPYQQTDDTSARVNGEFWHTHIVCNPHYTAFFTRPHKDRLTVTQDRYWDFYAALQCYRDGPTPAEANRLRHQFDELFATRTGYDALDDRIAKTAAKKELGARVSARRRDVSLHSRSVRGARAMDIFTTLVQTCKKLGISAYAYLRDRLCRHYAMPSLAASIRTAASV